MQFGARRDQAVEGHRVSVRRFNISKKEPYPNEKVSHFAITPCTISTTGKISWPSAFRPGRMSKVASIVVILMKSDDLAK